MKQMEEKILSDGQVLPGHILKVGGFLNQQIDILFMHDMAKEIAKRFAGCGVTKVMTIEASGIPMATLIALELGVKEVVVKKHASANLPKDLYTTRIASYTHGNTYTAALARDYLSAEDKVLIVDDFLATGNAIAGMRDMLKQAGAELAGCAIAIEKGFQGGGDELRAAGIRVESLAIVESMSDTAITFRENY